VAKPCETFSTLAKKLYKDETLIKSAKESRAKLHENFQRALRYNATPLTAT